MAAVAEGAKAPNFSMAVDDGGTAKLGDFAGKALVLYFYPKDDTSGCTSEALAFSGLAAAFAKKQAAILGVSKDPVTSHAKFKKKHGLKHTLASDESGVTEKYGVWVEKNMYGRKYMGIERATFLIDAKGKVRRVWRKVKVAGHAEEVLAALNDL